MSQINAQIDRQLKDYYFGDCKGDGTCMFCGRSGQSKEFKVHKGKKYFHKQYYVLWEKVTWFRGDDEIVGKVCKECKKNFEALMRAKLQDAYGAGVTVTGLVATDVETKNSPSNPQ